MSDSQQPTAPQTTVAEATNADAISDGDTTDAGKATGTDGKTFTQVELDRMVEQRIARERAKFADYDKIKADAAELAKIRDAEKTELQKAVERADQAEKRAAEAEVTALRSRVAAAKGVPASSLTGETEDELNASADGLIAWRDQQVTTQQTKQRPVTPPSGGGLRSGATGKENTSHDPKAAAAEALRRLRTVG